MDAERLELRALVTRTRAHERDYLYYGCYVLCCLLGITASLYFLTIDSIALQLLNAAFLAFVLVQIGMLGHDLSHGQVFKSRRANHYGAIIAWGLFGGLSESKWFTKHNAHHAHTNEMGRDPDLNIPFIFSDAQRGEMTGTARRLLPYQHVLFFLALPFIYLNHIRYSVAHTVGSFSAVTAWELCLIAVHFLIVISLPILFLPVPTALAFLATNFLCIGLYMSLVFAPNHKGKNVLGYHEAANWRHQIILTRNLRSSWLTFQLLGGLNFQIEHHLFPGVPRTAYFRLQPYVREFCSQHELPYDEVSWSESFRQIYHALRTQAQSRGVV